VGRVDGVEVLLEVGEAGFEVGNCGVWVAEAGAASQNVAVVDGAQGQEIGAGDDGLAE
jgi:hypothetical protein